MDNPVFIHMNIFGFCKSMLKSIQMLEVTGAGLEVTQDLWHLALSLHLALDLHLAHNLYLAIDLHLAIDL